MTTQLPPLPYDIPQAIMSKAANIKLALFDVDGVLTDGKLHYGANGEELKVFHALDGHGLKMLQAAGIDVGVISARKSAALSHRLSDLGVRHCFLGVTDKLSVFRALIDDVAVDTQHCAFTGDDVIDLAVMDQCGLTFSVQNGHFIVRHKADWVSPLTGGAGAVRSICDILLYSQNAYHIDSSHGQ